MPKCDFNKVAKKSNFIEIALRHGCSPVNLLHIFRTASPKNTFGWLLLLDISDYSQWVKTNHFKNFLTYSELSRMLNLFYLYSISIILLLKYNLTKICSEISKIRMNLRMSQENRKKNR